MTIPTRAERMDRLAELVSQGLEVRDAAIRMRVTKGYAYALWADIKRNLGWQAIRLK